MDAILKALGFMVGFTVFSVLLGFVIFLSPFDLGIKESIVYGFWVCLFCQALYLFHKFLKSTH